MKYIITFSFICIASTVYSQELSFETHSLKQILVTPAGPESYQLVYQKKESGNKSEQLYEIVKFDTALQVNSTHEFKIVGNYTLKEIIHDGGTSVVALLKASGDQLKFYVSRDGEKVSELFISLPSSYKRAEVKLFPLPDHEGFAVLCRTSKKSWTLKGMSWSGSILWSNDFNGTKALGVPFAFERSQQLVMVKTERERSRKQQSHLVVFDLAKGEKLKDQAISPSVGISRSVDNSFLKDDIVFVAGRQFNKKRIRQNKTGLPYLLAIDSSLTSAEHKLNGSLATMKFFPMDVVQDETGNLFMVGETFKSEGFFPYFLKGVGTGIATLGFVSVTWCNLKFQNALILPLDRQDAFPRIQYLPQRRVTVGSHLSAYDFARYAYKTGQVRYFGDRDGGIYLMNGDVMMKQSLKNTEAVRLGALPDYGRNVILRATDTKVLAVDYKYAPANKFSITSLRYIKEQQPETP